MPYVIPESGARAREYDFASALEPPPRQVASVLRLDLGVRVARHAEPQSRSGLLRFRESERLCELEP